MRNPNSDPLGLGLRQRAAEHQQRFAQQGQENARAQGQLVNFGQLGPLKDPMWDAMFQSWDEAGVDKVGDASTGARKGMFAPSQGQVTSTLFDEGQDSAISDSRQLNSGIHPALSGFYAAMRR
jgi:hypothetical protein